MKFQISGKKQMFQTTNTSIGFIKLVYPITMVYKSNKPMVSMASFGMVPNHQPVLGL
jgi:hypothetical protein